MEGPWPVTSSDQEPAPCDSPFWPVLIRPANLEGEGLALEVFA